MDENKTYGTRLARLWKLFLSTLYISSFTFGGGFVIVTFMKKKFVDELHWIDEQEMLDMTALAQSSPGAIAVNAAILVGWQVEGLIGMIVAVLGTIIPPMVILSVISVFYNAFATNRYIALLLKGMQAGVAAVILDVVFDLGGKVLKTRSWVYIVLMVAAFVANTVFDVNVVVIILAAAAFGVVRTLNQWKKKRCTMIYLQLFLSFLQVGMFSVGGGYAAMPLIQSQVVEQHGWLTMQEFTDLITIAEMTPGPIAVNSATFVGLRIAQVPGAIIATLGCITPALFFVSLLSYIYRKYKDISLLQSVLACLRPVIVALIFGAGLSILSMVVFGESAKTLANVDWIGIGSFASAFFVLRKLKLESHPDHVPVRRGRAWTSHFARI